MSTRLSEASDLPGSSLDPAALVGSSNPPTSMDPGGRLAFGGGRVMARESLRADFPPGRGTPVNISGGGNAGIDF